MIPSTDSSTSRQKKIYIWAAIAIIVGVVIWFFLFLRHPKNIASQTPSAGNSVQSPLAQTEGHTGNTQIAPEKKTYSAPKDQPRLSGPSHELATRQAPRNAGDSSRPFVENPNSSQPFVENPLQSIELHTMFTYETGKGVALTLPQGAVPFAPPEGAHAYLEGPDGNVRLDFVSTVFVKQDDSHIIVINNFSLPASSDLYSSPVGTLKNFDFVSIPIMAAGYESSFKTMVSFQGRVEVNGRYTANWGYGSSYMPIEQGGTRMRFPIGEALKQQSEEDR